MARIVGATDQRTPNTVSVGEAQVTHVRCGADILLTGMYQDVRGEAVCPVCGKTIEVRVEGGQVSSTVPPSAVLHYVVEDESVFGICCEDTFIFDKRECLDGWLKTYRDRPGQVSPLPEFFEMASKRRRERRGQPS